MAAPVPSQLDFLTTLRKIPKFGPKRVAALEAAGIKTIGDLLSYYPIKYVDRSKRVDIRDAGAFADSVVTVCGVVEKARVEYFGKAKTCVTVKDDSACELEAMWYIGNMKIEAGETLMLTGKVIDSHGKFLMIHPVLEKITKKSEPRLILAVYSIKEAMREAGVNQKLLRSAVEWALKNLGNYPRVLPDTIEKKQNFPPLSECLREVHIPSDLSALDKYKARLKYEELYRLALNLRWNKKKFALPGCAMEAGDLDARLRSALPFALTESQEAAIKVLYGDAARAHRMHRLLQGDVGSGKTITALFATLAALNSGRQVAWMAPTEVLARQTKAVVEMYLDKLGIRVEYIGAGDTPEKKVALRELASGRLQFAVGTHALFMPSVRFGNLGMVIIDEQHKFGAAQRLKLQEKGPSSDFLLMSATPIPQTLAKTLYGDLDIVEIASRPNRAPVSTHIVPHGKRRADMEHFILEQIGAGARAFYVVPRIDQQGDGDDLDGGDIGDVKSTKSSSGIDTGNDLSTKRGGGSPSIKTVGTVAEKLKKGPLGSAPIHTLHGRMADDERAAAIEAFKSGPPGVLVSTTIVEVGVDVESAAVMVVEDAERFGLAQLHQIRGRVGRGDRPSYCFLLPGVSASQNEKAMERLRLLCGCADGFEIAEQDLRSRGPGDAAGYRQSGWDSLVAADILADAGLFRAILGEIESLFAKET